MSEIVDAVRKMVKSMTKPDLLLGQVKSFDADAWTIEVELNQGATVDEVTIKSVLNGEDSGIFIEPEIGSAVLCGMTDGKLENLTVLVYAEIKNIRFAASQKVLLRSGDFGGIVKLQELETNLETLKTAIETLKTAVSTGLNAVGEGAAASGSAASAAYNAAAAAVSINFQNMENENVQHG